MSFFCLLILCQKQMQSGKEGHEVGTDLKTENLGFQNTPYLSLMSDWK